MKEYKTNDESNYELIITRVSEEEFKMHHYLQKYYLNMQPLPNSSIFVMNIHVIKTLFVIILIVMLHHHFCPKLCSSPFPPLFLSVFIIIIFCALLSRCIYVRLCAEECM